MDENKCSFCEDGVCVFNEQRNLNTEHREECDGTLQMQKYCGRAKGEVGA